MENFEASPRQDTGPNIQDEKAKRFRLRVMTPIRIVFDSFIDFAIVRSSEGDMGILHGHEPYSALLDYGLLRIFPDRKAKEELLLMVLGGTLRVRDNDAVVLSELAEHPDKLQEMVNQLEQEKAENKRLEQKLDLDMRRAESAIRRALVHIDLSAYSILKEHSETTDK